MNNTRPLILLPFLVASLCLCPGERPALTVSTLTIAFVGDVMLGRGVAQYIDVAYAGDWTAPFVAVQSHLSEADVSIANLESPLTTAPMIADGYDLRAPPEAVQALLAGGFDAVSLANNHALDAGEQGLQEMLNTLTIANIMPLLASRRLAADYNRAVFTASMPIKILALNDSVIPLDVEAAASATARSASLAPVVVSIHWGGEYQAAPGPRQQAIAARLAQAGAAVIVGHGPHVLQPIEWISDTLVAYSLGNFLFDQSYPVDCRWGAILHVTLRGYDVANIAVTPTVFEKGCVRPAHSEEACAILKRLRLPNASIQHSNLRGEK